MVARLRKCFAGCCWLVLAGALITGGARSLTVQLSADRARVGVGDVFTVTVAMTIDDGDSAPDPDLALPSGFDLVGSRSSTSTSISIVQGAVSQTKTVNVVSTIRANQEGDFTIGPATVRSGGKTLRSQAIRVDVTKAQPRPRASTTPGQQAVSTDQLREIEQNLFIRATPDRESVFVGEQILVTYDLFSRYRIQNPRFGVIPSFTGFWAEKVFEASRLEQRPEVVNGHSFKKSRLKQIALFPTLPGKQKLEQLEFICDIPVRSQRRSLFDVDDFFSWDPFRSRQVKVRASDLEVLVKPLPDGGPASFSGGVGVFEISAALSSDQAAEGDPLTVKVVVKGRGNIHGVGDPARPKTDQFRFYDPKGTAETQMDETVLKGTKSFDYVIIPTASGAIDLPPFELAYFDPAVEKYRTVTTRPISVFVTPAEKVEQVSMTTVLGTAVQLVGEDIQYIKADAMTLRDHADYLHTSSLYWSLNALSLVGLLAAWHWRRRQLMLEGDVAYARKRRSSGEARRRLSKSRSLLGADSTVFHSEVYRTLSNFLADRANLDISDLTTEQARCLLVERNVDLGLVDRVAGVFERCDFARFASADSGAADREGLLSQVEALIGELERTA